MKTFACILGLLILAGAEFLCFWTLRQHDFSTPAAIGITLGVCLTIFVLLGFMLMSRSAPYGRVLDSDDSDLRHRVATTTVARRPTVPTVPEETGYQMPVGSTAGSVAAVSHVQSEAFRDELVKALEEKRTQFYKVLADSANELSRFDYSVLKTLQRNSPGSVEGVITARKIHHALEYRYKEIERFLASQPAVDPEKGKQLLLGDLEIPEENQLTAVFKAPPIPPIKISEVEFQLRVLLKRISRRRSIFRPTDMMDAQMAAEASAAEAAAAAGLPPEANVAPLPAAEPVEGEEPFDDDDVPGTEPSSQA